MKLSYEQLQNAANNGENFVENLANGARGAVCNAYHNYKDWYHQNIDLLSNQAKLSMIVVFGTLMDLNNF